MPFLFIQNIQCRWIDPVLEFSGKEKWAIDIRRNAAPALSRGFYEACNLSYRPDGRVAGI